MAKQTEKQKCALCLEEKTLCSSHIIPEFLYKPLYDEKHRFHALSNDPDERNRMLQKGVREYLLCLSCEGKLSIWEKYAAEVLSGKLESTTERVKKLVVINGVDYKKFKLFQLSILWRASVSTQGFFKQVSLGQTEETLRKMLWEENAGAVEDFGNSMCCLTFNGNVIRDLIADPTVSDRADGVSVIEFIYGGFHFTFFPYVGEKFYFQDIFIHPSGRLVYSHKEIQEIPALRHFAKQMVEQGKFD